jgi:hypothetical protein
LASSGSRARSVGYLAKSWDLCPFGRFRAGPKGGVSSGFLEQQAHDDVDQPGSATPVIVYFHL